MIRTHSAGWEIWILVNQERRPCQVMGYDLPEAI